MVPKTDSEMSVPIYSNSLGDNLKSTFGIVQFDNDLELPFSVRQIFIRAMSQFYEVDFSMLPAFGIWSDRPESDEELLTELGGQWAPDGYDEELAT